ncbi:GGDEF domain-containing phosphodiesterase [Alteripontixanthobacter maritimus]|uniref:GGDEF domain-containing phosphodiesterase n=1 Tax=Alteripontixanthobacter maritimus TaxID=2161824 RepID=UPI001E293A5E|nr:GGDEF domain-containing phosphodiesterase [Alteripontixanthobacter maritimus]
MIDRNEPSRDMLTGLANRAGAMTRIAKWQAKAAAEGEAAPIHAMLIGIGRIATVNLAYGEAAGDGALSEIARRIDHFAADEFETGGFLAARLDGGKFLLTACEPCSRERWQWLGEALADSLAHPIAAAEGAGVVRLWPRLSLIRLAPGEAADSLLDRLAHSLDTAQRVHGKRLFWADQTAEVPGRGAAQLEVDLLAALNRDEIEICFQPQYSLSDGTLVGAEALARWQHPDLGLVGAGPLFEIAERADHVAQLSRHIAERALTKAAAWPRHLRMSLNITPADLASTSFAESFTGLLKNCGFPADRLTLELTEQVLLSDIEQAGEALGELRAAGMRIALDDFGAGFCNFRYLKVLPLDTLKLDRAMIEGIAEDPRDLAVLRGIIAMARALGLSLVAEGIETEAQRKVAKREGVEVVQGFLTGKPVGAEDFLKLTR